MPTALVTGSSRGLGEAYARELGERGYAVVLVARDAGRLAAAAERVGRATGAIVETMAADLTDARDLARVERRVADRALPIELLVNNAGVERDAVSGGAPVDGLTAEIDLDVTAVVRLTRAAVPVMTARARGGILNVAGVAGYLPGGGNACGASPSWVVTFTEAVAASLRGTGVRATAVVAGRVRGAGDPTGPLWLEPETVARRSLDDLGRGRTLSAPGWVYRALVGYLESPRRALRLAATLAGRGRGRERRARPGRAGGADVPNGADVPGGSHVRVSPVPGPFRDAPARPLSVVAAAPQAPVVLRSSSDRPAAPGLPALPPRPRHTPARVFPEPRRRGTGSLPVVPARPAARPVQPPRGSSGDGTGLRLVSG